jgi:hypothetical protein
MMLVMEETEVMGQEVAVVLQDYITTVLSIPEDQHLVRLQVQDEPRLVLLQQLHELVLQKEPTEE